MNEMLKSAVVLAIVCLVSALSLGLTYNFTKGNIDKQLAGEVKNKLNEVMPDATEFKVNEDYYIAYRGTDIIGFAAILEAKGYSSTIKIMAGMDLNKSITKVRILEQAETPGLGTRITEPAFYDQFDGKTSKDIVLRKFGGKIDGITGATISSKAVTDGVKQMAMGKLEQIADEHLNSNR